MSLVPTLVEFVAKEYADADDVNSNFNVLRNVLNGNVDSNNLASDSVTADEHADISTSTETYHCAESISFSGDDYTSTNLSDAMDEVGTFVGLGTTGGKGLIYVGVDYDASTANDCLVSTAADTGVTGLILSVSAKLVIAMNAAATAGIYLPLEVKVGDGAWTAMSASGSEDPRFHLELSASDCSVTTNVSKTTTFTTANTPAFDGSEIVQVRFGTAWYTGSPTAWTASEFLLMVQAIR